MLPSFSGKKDDEYLEKRYASPPPAASNDPTNMICPIIMNNNSPSKLMSLANITTADAALNLARMKSHSKDGDQKKLNTTSQIQSTLSISPLQFSRNSSSPSSPHHSHSSPQTTLSHPHSHPSSSTQTLSNKLVTNQVLQPPPPLAWSHEQRPTGNNDGIITNTNNINYALMEPLLSDENSACSNFVCCGYYLADLHALLQHYEEYHIKIEDEIVEASS